MSEQRKSCLPERTVHEPPKPLPKIIIKVKEIQGKGTCSFGHVVGQTIKYPEELNQLCPWAFYAVFPVIQVLLFGGTFFYEPDPDKTYIACSDPYNEVVFEVARVWDEA